MPRVELVYFGGCPNVDRARSALVAAGFANFIEINQDALVEGDPYRTYSSPTVLVNGEIVAGSRNGAASCSIVDWSVVFLRMKTS
jgi:hypothetical protein